MKAQRLLYGNSEWGLARFSEERPIENSNVKWTADDKGRKKVSLTLITGIRS